VSLFDFFHLEEKEGVHAILSESLLFGFEKKLQKEKRVVEKFISIYAQKSY